MGVFEKAKSVGMRSIRFKGLTLRSRAIKAGLGETKVLLSQRSGALIWGRSSKVGLERVDEV